MAELVLGPMLRYADASQATVWVETGQPCQVSVLGSSSTTFTVHGRHYALVHVDLDGLTPNPEYQVHLDDDLVWPDPALDLPASRIRTRQADDPVRISFGSCRITLPPDEDHSKTHGVDVLHALANRGMVDADALPDLIYLAGDQIYADEVVGSVASFVCVDSDEARPPKGEAADYEEYARLYRLAWSEPTLRWLLSTVPVVMGFDDHDVRDDWNTSQAWRDKSTSQPWWPRRIAGALGSVWVYQYIGNLHPDELSTDPLLQALQAHPGDSGKLLDDYALEADRHPRGHRWTFARDLGSTRLVVVDTRAGRVTEPSQRAMLDADEWDWLVDHATGGVDHLLIGSSLPYLLPVPLHDIEAWDEAVAGGAWGARWSRWGEYIRQNLDLEHWASFHRSFTALADHLTAVARGERGPAPRTILFLSGDVHYGYAAQADVDGAKSQVWQLVSSPMRNPLGGVMRFINVVAFWKPLTGVARLLRRKAGVPEPAWQWQVKRGPWWNNNLCTLTLQAGGAHVVWERSRNGETEAQDHLEELGQLDVTAVSLPTSTRL